MQAQEYVRQAGLRETPFGQSINEKTFTSNNSWCQRRFRLNLETLEEHAYVASLSRKQRVQLEVLRRWCEAVAPHVEFNLEEEHAHWWTHVLYEQHLGFDGNTPPRRLVDNPALWPGVSGGRQPAPQD